VSQADGRRIVGAVTGHGDHSSDPLVGTNDPDLIGWGDAGKDGDGWEDLVERGIPQGVNVGTGKDAMAVQDVEFGGDRRRRTRVISGDHDHFDTGGTQIGDGPCCGRTYRVSQPEETEENHVGDPFISDLCLGRSGAFGNGKDA
jgi:hypothetical protein